MTVANRLLLTAGLLLVLALPAAGQDEIELSYSHTPTQASTKLGRDTTVYIRPNVKTPLYLHARGPSAVGEVTTIQLFRVLPGQEEALFAWATTKVSKATQGVKGWKPAAVTPTPPELDYPMQLLVKVIQNGKEVKSHRLTLNVQRPDEYLQVRSQTFDEAKQEIRVTLAAKGKSLIGGPCEVVLDLDNSPHPLLKRPIPRSSVRLSGELTREGDDITLRAGKLAFLSPQDNSRLGPVYVSADGVARAFIFETDFKGTGRIFPDPKLRLAVPDYIQAKDELVVGVEADNVPWTDVKLHVWLDMNDNGSPDRNETQVFPSARRLGVVLPAPAEDGAVVLQSTARDWAVKFNTKTLADKVKAGAWLEVMGKGGGQDTRKVSTTRTLVIDETPPKIIELVKPARPHVVNQPLVVTVRGDDEESGIKEVWVGVGAASDDPKWRKKAVLARPGARKGEWTATLAEPAAKGALEVGVVFVNRAGKQASDTFEVGIGGENQGGGPAQAKTGTVVVEVLEGELRQNQLTVALVDEKNQIVQTAVTVGGKAVFKDVPPGKYTATSSKPASMTEGRAAVAVTAGRTTQVEVKLFRK